MGLLLAGRLAATCKVYVNVNVNVKMNVLNTNCQSGSLCMFNRFHENQKDTYCKCRLFSGVLWRHQDVIYVSFYASIPFGGFGDCADSVQVRVPLTSEESNGIVRCG
jgi:hypothetical protein